MQPALVERNSPRVMLKASHNKWLRQYLELNLAERNSPRARPKLNLQQKLVERDSPRKMLNPTITQCQLKRYRAAHGEHLVLSKGLAEPSSPRQIVKTNLNLSSEARPVQSVGISPSFG